MRGPPARKGKKTKDKTTESSFLEMEKEESKRIRRMENLTDTMALASYTCIETLYRI